MQFSLSLLSLIALPALISATVLPRATLGNLGGAPPAVANSGNADRPFEVNGNTFVNESAAIQRACDIQNNACFNAFNANSKAAGFTQADCQAQQLQCAESLSAGGSASDGGAATVSTTTAAATAATATDEAVDDECDADEEDATAA